MVTRTLHILFLKLNEYHLHRMKVIKDRMNANYKQMSYTQLVKMGKRFHYHCSKCKNIEKILDKLEMNIL